jgi:hypothetical protein
VANLKIPASEIGLTSADISHYLCMMAAFCGSIDGPF